jgi:hypothetical protein
MDVDMATTPRTRLDFYPSPELRLALDRWRIEQDGSPSRAEAARQLIEEALVARGAFKPAKPIAKRAKAPAVAKRKRGVATRG